MGRQYPAGIKNNEHFMVGSTSLPPKIDGQLRRHVVIEIPFIKWLDKRSNPNVFASVLWWGEEGKGTIFRPANEESQKTSKRFIRAIYGIISGPKRFSDYLNDMKVMLINIFNESDSLPIGRAQVKNLSSLSPSHSISGLYPVTNTNNKKIAEIKVHLSIVSLESLQEGGVEVPTPDGGLDPVEDSETFLGDLKAARGVTHAFEKSPYGADDILNSLEIVGKRINTFGSNGKELRGVDSHGIVDSIVDSLEKLRIEMTNSCLKVDVSGPVMETHGDLLASTLPNSSHLLPLQPADLILNSILDDGIRDFSHKFSGPMRASDDQKLLEHDELYELFYRNVPNPLDDVDISKSMKMSKEPKTSLKTSVLKDSDVQLPPKLRRELKQASGILVLVNSFTAVGKLFVKEVRSDRELSSDCMLSISLSNALDYADAQSLVKMKPLLVKLKGRVLQFNQKIIIGRTSLGLEDRGIFHQVLLFKLLERTSLSKFKVICRAECGVLDLLSTRERGSLKVNLEDNIGKCLGSLEINLKILLEQRENDRNENLSDETRNANKRARICESEERNNLRKDVPMCACLVVPQGHVFATHSTGADCVTLKVRNHWSDSTTVKSTISKDGRILFNLVQVHSLSLSAALVSKMKLNYVIVEAWTSNDSEIKNGKKEQLLGISKLPINTFHESFCNQERLQSSVDSSFPVVAIDGNVPIAYPASGTNGGLLQVLLAMGTYDQVLRLMDFKMKTFPEFFHDSIRQLSLGSGERSHSMHPETVEHMLELCIESVTKLTSCESLEEMECYVRFIFPDLQDEKFQLMRQQTSVVPCIRGNVKFNELFRQLVILPRHVSFCWHICKAYSANKLPNEMKFQLWSKNHFSKVSDRLIAEGALSLNEFFRAIDAKVPGDVGSSSEFSIEMMKSSPSSAFRDEAWCGFMNIRVLHSSAAKEQAMLPSHANPLVEQACLSVQILRACGLKCAAQAMQDSELEHKWNSQKGLNTFLTTSLVINGQTNTKVTRVVGGSFRPAFNTHFEFLCPLNFNNSLATPEKTSYLQLFEKAYLEVNVYNTNVDEGDNVKTSSGNNVLIGRVKIFLIDVLKRRTGLRGWFPIERPQQDAVKRRWHDQERSMLKHVGGIEMAVEFSSSVLESVLREERMLSSALSSVASAKKCNIQLRIDNLSFPLESLLHHGSPRNGSARCYVAYKFFDQDTIYSQFYPLSLRAGILNVDMNHVRDFQIVSSSTFFWYLTEERLEIEVWMSHGASEDKLLPQADDEHVGSGYVSLVDLVEFNSSKAISSGYCPLFNARSDYLGSACLHYNVQASISEVDQEAGNNTSGVDKKVENFREEDNFLARVAIERAYHLPKQLDNHKQVLPNAYVTFETSTSFESTKVAEMDCDPVWNDEVNVWLSKEFLNKGHENNLMLKVWHKSKLENHEFGDISSDKCLGFASVDLKPLLSEKFQSITGFYNINDYNGSQQGQIKVSVTPLQKVTSPSNEIEMRDDKIGTDDVDIESSELVTKNITDALEELTTRLKRKISQSFDILSHPTQDLQSSARDARPEHDHPGDRIEFNEATNERHPSPQAFEENLTPQNSSPNIFIQNYNLEPCECECDDFEEHLSDNKQDCISMNESPEGNDAVGLFSREDSISQGGIEDCECSSVPHSNFTEKSVQTETPVATREVFENDLQNSLEIKPESARSTPSSLASDLAERKNILIGDWLSEHKRKVSQRIVAFKSFKVPSIEESQRIAKILANKLQ